VSYREPITSSDSDNSELDEGNIDGAGGMVEGDQRSEMDGKMQDLSAGVDVETVNEEDDEGN
jgi:hypothetical protein